MLKFYLLKFQQTINQIVKKLINQNTLKNQTTSNRDISNYSIFGEYKAPENRVTAALLHILRSGGEDLIKELLREEGFPLPDSDIKVETQVGNAESVPDGKLSCNFNFQLFIESKVQKNAINIKQLENHRKQIVLDNDRLIYITPDNVRPPELDGNELWYNWRRVVDILIKYENKSELLGYLIEQFKLLVENLSLYDYSQNRVMVVGGSYGEEVALKYNFYACQNRRSFLSSKYLAFAHKNRIKYLFEIIGEPEDNVNLKNAKIAASYFTDSEPNYQGLRKLFRLKLVKTFNPEIENNNKDKNGNRCAFIQRQTYTTYENIVDAKFTSEL